MARLPEGLALAPHVTAMMDVSDGLLLDDISAFLDRPAIYLTAPMRSQEHRARANLAAELSGLL